MVASARKRRAGFTLIEVLLVIGILLVLSTVGVVAYSKIKANSDRDATKALIDQTAQAVELYHTQMGVYPTTEDGLKALIAPPSDEKLAEKWKNYGPFLKDGKIPVDPWMNELKYELEQTSSDTEVTGPAFHVWSTGPDGQDGNDDDIRNWSTDTSK